ncbi:MAG: sterol desaturase family protein, partial [Myxococcota bacterium]|nr:sterol desaturase family protein [Myxococcota bacterium]
MPYETARLLVLAIMGGFAVLELVRGSFWHRGIATRRDALLDAASMLTLPVLVFPAVLAVAPHIAEAIRPDSEGWLSHLPGWAMFGLLLIGDDLTQYWWHRMSHRWLWLFPLHRAHHSAPYMSVRVVYRNNIVYYLLMPGIWISALLLYWGFGSIYGTYLVLKMAVIISAHSDQPWDAALYRRAPRLMWFVERRVGKEC